MSEDTGATARTEAARSIGHNSPVKLKAWFPESSRLFKKHLLEEVQRRDPSLRATSWSPQKLYDWLVNNPAQEGIPPAAHVADAPPPGSPPHQPTAPASSADGPGDSVQAQPLAGDPPPVQSHAQEAANERTERSGPDGGGRDDPSYPSKPRATRVGTGRLLVRVANILHNRTHEFLMHNVNLTWSEIVRTNTTL